MAKSQTVGPGCDTSPKSRKADIQADKDAEKKAEKLAKNSPYKRFGQYNLDETPRLMWLALENAPARAILDFFVDQMDGYNGVVISLKNIEELLQLSHSTVSLAIKCLKKYGFIEIYKAGNANIYAVNDEIAWKSWGKNRVMSKFPVNVIISLDEQDEKYRQIRDGVNKLAADRTPVIVKKEMALKGGKRNETERND